MLFIEEHRPAAYLLWIQLLLPLHLIQTQALPMAPHIIMEFDQKVRAAIIQL
jgi:hypothetical protein